MNLRELEPILADMQMASDAVDDAAGTSDYTARLVALALIARHYLRERAVLSARSAEKHEHQFHTYVVCSECGETEAAILGCHHCDEVKPGRLCQWCLRKGSAHDIVDHEVNQQ